MQVVLTTGPKHFSHWTTLHYQIFLTGKQILLGRTGLVTSEQSKIHFPLLRRLDHTFRHDLVVQKPLPRPLMVLTRMGRGVSTSSMMNCRMSVHSALAGPSRLPLQ